MKPTPSPTLCYVTDRHSLAVRSGANRAAALLGRIRAASAAGVGWIQIREKDLDAAALYDLTVRAVVTVREGGAARILVNDRLDVAWAAGAAGVHLGESSLPVSEAVRSRSLHGPRNLLVGASCHSLEAVQAAERSGADYVFFGPVFATPSKQAYGPPQGLTKLAAICRAVRIPVLAIGGITGENSTSCLEAGAAGIAAIRLFQHHLDLANRLGKIR